MSRLDVVSVKSYSVENAMATSLTLENVVTRGVRRTSKICPKRRDNRHAKFKTVEYLDEVPMGMFDSSIPHIGRIYVCLHRLVGSTSRLGNQNAHDVGDDNRCIIRNGNIILVYRRR